MCFCDMTCDEISIHLQFGSESACFCLGIEMLSRLNITVVKFLSENTASHERIIAKITNNMGITTRHKGSTRPDS